MHFICLASLATSAALTAGACSSLSGSGSSAEVDQSGYGWSLTRLQLFTSHFMHNEIPLDPQGENLDGVWDDSQYFVRLEAKNTGSKAWKADGPGRVRLATINPNHSLYYVPITENEPDGWLTDNRPRALDADVNPGDSYVFKFPLDTPADAGTYAQSFVPVVEPDGFLPDLGATLDLTVVDNPNKLYTAAGFATNCDIVGSFHFDPIGSPGKITSNAMDFFGSKGVGATTTYASLRAYSDGHDKPSTCLKPEMDSTVTMHSQIHLVSPGGGGPSIVPGAGAFLFYQPLHNIDPSFYPYETMPNGLRIRVDASMTKIKWGCSGNGTPNWDSPRDCHQYDNPGAGKISHVSAQLTLPTCWDGLNNDGDTDGYHAHVAYKIADQCPHQTDKLLPAMILSLNWASDTDDERNGYLYDPTDVQSLVVGFINGWYEAKPSEPKPHFDLNALTDFCINGNNFQGCGCGAVVNAVKRIGEDDCRVPQ